MGGAHVGQIDVMVAGMIPVANVEAKVRHAAALWPHNNLTQRIAVCSLGCEYFGRKLGRGVPLAKARVSKRSYVVKAALRGTDRETELAVDRRRDQPSLKRPLRAAVTRSRSWSS